MLFFGFIEQPDHVGRVSNSPRCIALPNQIAERTGAKRILVGGLVKSAAAYEQQTGWFFVLKEPGSGAQVQKTSGEDRSGVGASAQCPGSIGGGHNDGSAADLLTGKLPGRVSQIERNVSGQFSLDAEALPLAGQQDVRLLLPHLQGLRNILDGKNAV